MIGRQRELKALREAYAAEYSEFVAYTDDDASARHFW